MKLFTKCLSNQISLRGSFLFKTNGRISYTAQYKDHNCSFITDWALKQPKKIILKTLKNLPVCGVNLRRRLKVKTLFFWCLYIVNKKNMWNQPGKKHSRVILRRYLKKNVSIIQVLGTVYFTVCYMYNTLEYFE